MEQYFRIAIWMFCLVACLQAKPVQKRAAVPFDIDDLGFFSLNGTTCDASVTFKTPVMPTQSRPAALDLFIKELSRATKACEHEDNDAALVADNVKKSTPKELKLVPGQSPDCQWENKGYEEFPNLFQKFLETINVDYAK